MRDRKEASEGSDHAERTVVCRTGTPGKIGITKEGKQAQCRWVSLMQIWGEKMGLTKELE